MRLSSRIKKIPLSATLSISSQAKKLSEEGKDILNLSIGEPDFNTPEHVKFAAIQAINNNKTHYTNVAGTIELRQIIIQKIYQNYDLSYNPDQVIVSNGAKQILFNALASLIEAGDEVIFASPYWLSYPDMIRFFDGIPVPVKASNGSIGLPEAKDIEACITSKTRVLIINSPSNPTGAVYDIDSLKDIIAMLERYPNIIILSDDIYSHLVYGTDFVSILHLCKKLKERTLIIAGVSKSYAMTGWRIGYGIGPLKLIKAMLAFQGITTSAPSSISQEAALQALSGKQENMIEMRQIFHKRRDIMYKGLKAIPHLDVFFPFGAFYIFPKINAYFTEKINSSLELSLYLLNNFGLAVIPGNVFGADDHIRLSYACSDDKIKRSLQLLQNALVSLNSLK